MDMEQKVEQRAKALDAIIRGPVMWSEASRAIARAELECEGKLVDALRFAYCQRGMSGCSCVSCRNVDKVLAAYESEFAPPKRTLAQVAADVVRGYSYRDDSGDEFCAVRKKFVDELAEALKREGGA